MGFFAISVIGIIMGVSTYILFRVYLEKKVSNGQKLYNLYNGFALVFALIALSTSWIWPYLFNMFIALPALLLALAFAQRAKVYAPSQRRFLKLNYAIMISAILISIIVLIAMQYR